MWRGKRWRPRKSEMEARKKLSLEELQKINLDKLWLKERIHVEKLIHELKIRKQYYPILDFKPQKHQEELINAVWERNEDWLPKYKFIMFIGWNWSWKTTGN